MAISVCIISITAISIMIISITVLNSVASIMDVSITAICLRIISTKAVCITAISIMFDNKALRKNIWDYDGGPKGRMGKISQQKAS